jgi:uroporphyrinogen-III synthase
MKATFAVPSVVPRPLAIPASPEHLSNWAGEDFDLALLSRIASRISSAAPLQNVLNDVVEFAAAVVRCDSCMVYVLENEDLVLRASMNPHPEVVNRLKMKLGQGITGWVAQHLEPVIVARGAYEDTRFKLFNELPEDRFESFLSIPVVSGGRLVGVINVQNRAQHSFSKREISLIATLGFLVGAEIERARLEGENLYLSDRLEARKIIERAKGILQRDLRLSEEDAYLTLQRESRQRRKSMREVSEAVILSEDLKKRRAEINA